MSQSSLRRLGARALACACALAVAGGARAQDSTAPAGEPVELPEVLVRVPRAEARSDPAASATVISADRFAGEAKGVAELLSTAPGVAITRYGTLGQRVTLELRGVSAEGVKVLLDGLPLGGAGGSVDLATIPRAWIERIEVVRGLAGARHGAGALGGAVDVLTRTPRAGELSAEASAGAFGTYALSGDGAARAGPFTLLVAAGGETTRGDFGYLLDRTPDVDGDRAEPRTRTHNGATRGGALAKLGGLAGGLRLDALLAVSGGVRDLPGPPRAPTPDDWQRDGRLAAMARVAGFPREGLAAALRLHARADLLDTRLLTLGGRTSRQRGGAGGAEVEVSVLRGPAELGASLLGEVEGYDAAALGGTRGRATIAGALAAHVAAAGGRLRLSPALRAERVGSAAGLSASFGAALRLAGELSLRASAGRTFRAPTFAELWLQQGLVDPNPDLSPESGAGGDAALVYDGRLGLASVGAHATLLRDVITYEFASPGGRFRPANAREARVAGIEAELATAPVRRLLGLSLSAAYTFLPTRILRGPQGVVGSRLPHRPLHRIHARAAVATRRAGAHLEAELVREQWRDVRNQDRIPDATVLGAGAFVRLVRDPALSLHVQLDNLGDERALTDGFGQPLPGRTLMVSVRAGGSVSAPAATSTPTSTSTPTQPPPPTAPRDPP